MIAINVKRTKAWDADTAPIVWAFFNAPKSLDSIFKEVTKLTESAHTQEHPGKFYYNNITKLWYTHSKKSVDLAVQKIKEQNKDAKVNISWNII